MTVGLLYSERDRDMIHGINSMRIIFFCHVAFPQSYDFGLSQILNLVKSDNGSWLVGWLVGYLLP